MDLTMSTMPKIEPECPYCEAKDELKYIYIGQNYRRAVRCGGCGFSGPAPRIDPNSDQSVQDKAARIAWRQAVQDIQAGQWVEEADVVAASEVETILDDFRKPHERDVYRENPLKGIRQVLSRLEDERDELIRSRNQAGEYISDIGEALGLPRGDRIPTQIIRRAERYRTAVDQIQTIRDAVQPLFGRWSIQKEDPTPDQVRKLIRAADRLQDEVDQFTEAEKQRLGSPDANRWGALREAFTSLLDELGVPPGEFDWSDIDDIVEAGKAGREQIDGLKDETRFKEPFQTIAKALMDYSEPPKRADKVAGHMVDKIRKLQNRRQKARNGLEQIAGFLDIDTDVGTAKLAGLIVDVVDPSGGRVHEDGVGWNARAELADELGTDRSWKAVCTQTRSLKARLIDALDREDAGWETVDDPDWDQIIEGVEWAVDHICQAPDDHRVLADIRTTLPRVDQGRLPNYAERLLDVAIAVSDHVCSNSPAPWELGSIGWDNMTNDIKEAGSALDIVQKLVPHRQFEDHAAGELDIDEVWEAIRSNTYLYSHAEQLGQRWEQVCEIFGASPDSPEDALHRMRKRESIARNANQFLTELAELLAEYRNQIDPDHEQG